MVVKAPKKVLQPDLADSDRAASGGLSFTHAQLDAYGIKELHVLEDVIRSGDRKALAEVAARIRAKIAWDGPTDVADRTFLNAYYAGLRGRLESRMLFGHRRKDKFDVS
ncbi:MAG TPA: RDD family protein, partial [Phenylobacterium sp.]|nr:RDD family protein [Phenylobacterium sp.]